MDNYEMKLALNRVPGVRFVELIGHNPDVDTGTVPESLWHVGGVYSFRSAAAICEVVSSDTADDGSPAGTGAWAITIEGLDADYLEVSETITLNGTSAVDGTVEFLRINKAYVTGVGSGGVNAGNITIRDNGAGTTRGYIAAGEGISDTMVYTVPADHTLLLDGWYATARDSSGASQADISFFVRRYGESERLEWQIGVDKVFPSPFDLPHPIPEKSDLYAYVTYVGGATTVVSFHGHGVLVGPYADV
jgi:hypothetical protein